MDPKHLLDFEKPVAELNKKVETLKKSAKTGEIDMSSELELMEDRIKKLKKEIFSSLSPNQIVSIARHPKRPSTIDYVNLIFRDFLELHGVGSIPLPSSAISTTTWPASWRASIRMCPTGFLPFRIRSSVVSVP